MCRKLLTLYCTMVSFTRYYPMVSRTTPGGSWGSGINPLPVQCCGMVSNLCHPFSIKQGVKQGAVLSPLLYSLFVNYLLVELEHSGLGVIAYSVELQCTQMTSSLLPPPYCLLPWGPAVHDWHCSPICHKVQVPSQLFKTPPSTTWAIKGEKLDLVKYSVSTCTSGQHPLPRSTGPYDTSTWDGRPFLPSTVLGLGLGISIWSQPIAVCLHCPP